MVKKPASAGAARRAPAQPRAKPEPKKLTDKQGAFALEYVVDLNATRAATAAGFSAKTAAVQGYQLLQNPLVRKEIDRLKEERAERLKMDADRLLLRLLEEVHADVADLFDEVGGLKPIHEWPMAFRTGLIGGFEVEEEYGDEDEAEEGLEQQGHGGALKRAIKRKIAVGRISKIKLSDRTRRLELIGKHTGVRAFDRTVPIKLDDAASVLKQLGELVSGRSIRPQGAK